MLFTQCSYATETGAKLCLTLLQRLLVANLSTAEQVDCMQHVFINSRQLPQSFAVYEGAVVELLH